MGENGGGYRDKMRGECVAMYAILLKRKKVFLEDVADELGISVKTARRWATCFSLIAPLRIEHGALIMGEDAA